MHLTTDKLRTSIDGVCRWVETHNYMGYEPSDGNLSPLHVFTLRSTFLERALQQVIWKSPFDLRRLAGVPMHRSTKGTGYMAWGYVLMHRETGDRSYRERAESCFRWLMDNSAPNYPQHCWGDSFPFASRGGRRPRFEPTIVWSSLIGQAFLDGYDTFGHSAYLDVVNSICEWIFSLPRYKTSTGLCLGYTRLGHSTIHNSNMLGAALLARWSSLSGDRNAMELARESMAFSCTRQTPDGAWAYGDAPKWRWIDNFHTGYNLDSLAAYMDATGDTEWQPELERGVHYYAENFFEADGRPRYYQNNTYPIDIQSCSQSIETLVRFSSREPALLPLARKTANWTIDNMQDSDGHFYYRDVGWRKIKTPMLHWGQATMFKALAYLLLHSEPTASSQATTGTSA